MRLDQTRYHNSVYPYLLGLLRSAQFCDPLRFCQHTDIVVAISYIPAIKAFRYSRISQ